MSASTLNEASVRFRAIFQRDANGLAFGEMGMRTSHRRTSARRSTIRAQQPAIHFHISGGPLNTGETVMPVDTRKALEAVQAEAKDKPIEEQTLLALQRIAASLECIRAEVVLLQNAVVHRR